MNDNYTIGMELTWSNIVNLLSLKGTWESPFAMDSTTLLSAMFPWFIFAVCNFQYIHSKLEIFSGQNA